MLIILNVEIVFAIQGWLFFLEVPSLSWLWREEGENFSAQGHLEWGRELSATESGFVAVSLQLALNHNTVNLNSAFEILHHMVIFGCWWNTERQQNSWQEYFWEERKNSNNKTENEDSYWIVDLCLDGFLIFLIFPPAMFSVRQTLLWQQENIITLSEGVAFWIQSKTECSGQKGSPSEKIIEEVSTEAKYLLKILSAIHSAA